MEEIDVKHWYAIEKMIDDLKEDQKKALSAKGTPIEIAGNINSCEKAIYDLKDLLEQWKTRYSFPNVTNLKYVYRY